MSSPAEADTTPITEKTKIIVRGATTHFKSRPSFYQNIIAFCRANKIRRIVVTCSMACQGLLTYLTATLTRPSDPRVERTHTFDGDDDSMAAAITGQMVPTPAQLKCAYKDLAQVLRRMHRCPGRILIVCQVGRNRSFTTAFIYYLVYYGAGYSVVENLSRFRKWSGVSYDTTVQRDGFQRLDPRRPGLPWMRFLRHLFEDPATHRVTRARIDAFMSQ